MSLLMTSLCDENRRHDRISRYDEVNHLFWYTEDIARIVLTDRTSRRYSTSNVFRNPAFFKTHYENWLSENLLVKLNCVEPSHLAILYLNTA